jgi:hypothetical protein
MYRYDAFISYNHNDSSFVSSLFAELNFLGLSIAYDKTHLAPGDEWSPTLRKLIESSRAFILVIGNDPVSAPVAGEIAHHMSHNNLSTELGATRSHFLPILLPNSSFDTDRDGLDPQIRLYIKRTQYQDLQSNPVAITPEQRCRLVSAIRDLRPDTPPFHSQKACYGPLRRLRITLNGKTLERQVLTINNYDPDNKFLLDWASFGHGIEILNAQVRDYRGYPRLSIGINETGCVIAFFLGFRSLNRSPVGLIRFDGPEDGGVITEHTSSFPCSFITACGPDYAPTEDDLRSREPPLIFLFDFEIKSGDNLVQTVNFLNKKFDRPRIVFATFSLALDRPDFERLFSVGFPSEGVIDLKDTPLERRLNQLDIHTFFVASVMPSPGINPPFAMR